MKLLLNLLATLLIFSACSTIDVSVDYDPDYSLNSKKTFTFMKSKNKINTLDEKRLNKAIISQMKIKGYRYIDSKEKADLYIMYNIDVTSKTKLYTDYQMVGIRPYGRPMAVATTRTYEYEEGKLVLALIDPKQKAVVWQGVATDSLKDFDSPQEKETYINEVIQKVLQDLPVAK